MSYTCTHCGHVEGIGKWKPKYNEVFWYVTYDGKIHRAYWTDMDYDNPLYTSGRVFKTESNALEVAQRIKEILIAYQNSL